MRRFVIIPARCESFLASGSRSVTKGKIVEREILWIELFTMEFFFFYYIFDWCIINRYDEKERGFLLFLLIFDTLEISK